MSDTDDDTTSTSDDEETSSNEDSNDSDDNEEENDGDSSEEEQVELIQVGDVRTAFSMATGGKNVCGLEHFPSVLDTLNIKLNEKRTTEFFNMLDEDATNEVGWNAMFYALRDGQGKFKGLPMDQVVGGLLYEFAASERGRKRKAIETKKSMISFMSNLGQEVKIDTTGPSLGIPTEQEKPAGLSKPTRKLPATSTEPTINEDEEEDTFNINDTQPKINDAPWGIYIYMNIILAL